MIVYRELSSLERDLGFPASTLYAVSNRLNSLTKTSSLGTECERADRRR